MVDITKLVPDGIVPLKTLKLAQQKDKIKSAITSGLELDASTVAATLKADLGVLETDLRALVSPIPTLPSINLQSELQSLMALGANTPDGIAKLASMKSKFGAGIQIDAINDLGTSNMASKIDDMVGQIPGFKLPAGGASELLQSGKLQGLLDAASNAGLGSLTEGLNPISGKIPNFDLPAGATESIQKAQSVVLPTVAAIAEKISTFNIADSPMNEVTGEVGDLVAAAVERISGEGKYTFPNPEVDLLFPDKLQDLSGQLGGITESLGTQLAGMDIPSADLSAITEQLAVIKRQVQSSNEPLESSTVSANLQTALDGLKTQLLNSDSVSSDQVSSLVGEFDTVKKQVEPPVAEIEQTVQSATKPEKEYSQGEVDALTKQQDPSFTEIKERLQEYNRMEGSGTKYWIYRGTGYFLIEHDDVKYGDYVLANQRSGNLGRWMAKR